jgi:hypothetical protein
LLWFCLKSSFVFFAQDCCCYSKSFVLPYELQDWFFSLYEECHQNFDGDFIEHTDFFGSIAIFTILILQILENGRSFHLLLSFLIFFFSDIVFVIQVFYFLC